MTHLRSLPVVAALLLTSLPGPAHAGGWWSFVHLDGPWIGVGETVRVTASPVFDTIAGARRARASHAYRAYLIQGVDRRMVDEAMAVAEPGDWWTPPDEVVLAGTARVLGGKANLRRVVARITVPDLPPGRYSLMLCTEGCAEPLANLLPARVIVSEDPVLAGRARELSVARERLRSRAARLDHRLRGARRRAQDLRRQLGGAEAEAGKLTDRVRELSAVSDRPAGAGAGGVGWFAAGLALGGAFSLGRRRGGLRSQGAGASVEPAPARR